jgi:hypothetical protein
VDVSENDPKGVTACRHLDVDPPKRRQHHLDSRPPKLCDFRLERDVPGLRRNAMRVFVRERRNLGSTGRNVDRWSGAVLQRGPRVQRAGGQSC